MKNTKLIQQVSEVFERGVLIDLDISWWAGQAKLRAEDLGIPKENFNDELFSLGRKRFIPKNWVGKFRKYEQKGRMIVELYAFNFKKRSGWFVPLKAVPKLLEELETCKEKFTAAVKEFLEAYPQIMERMIVSYQDELPKIYQRFKTLSTEVPSERSFIDKFMVAVKSFYPRDPSPFFRFSWTFFEFSLPREFKLKETNIRKKIAEVEREAQKERMLIQQYQDSFQEEISGFLHSVVSELRGAVIELTERISKQIADGRITDTRIERLKEYIGRFKLLNFVDDKEVANALEDLKKNLEHSAEEYNSNGQLAEALRNSLRNTVLAASKKEAEVIAASFGTKRKILRKK